MRAAVQSVHDGKGLREASRLYNVPVETLRRRTTGKVELDCKPGPSTVLTKEEEDRLNTYLIQMAEMGFGLTSEDVMQMAYIIVDKSWRAHPFTNGKAGRGWFEGFRARYPRLTIRTPQPLSYCRALCSNKETIDGIFGKLGALYGRLNLMSKPLQIFNADESGVSIVHKPGKVVAELGQQNVYAITAAERGHSSHISIELIELARQNDVHLLCFPAHTTHILQPLNVGVFKSFKANFSKAYHKYIISHPGRVITSDVIAALVVEAWAMSLTPVSIMSGFKKCGI